MRRGAWVVAAVALLAGCSSGQTSTRITAGDAAALPPPAPRSGELAGPVEPHALLTELCDDYCDYLLAAEANDCPEPTENVALCADYLERIRQVAFAVNGRLGRDPRIAPMGTEISASARTLLDEHAAFLRAECPSVLQEQSPEDAACAEQAGLIRETAADVGRLIAEAARSEDPTALTG